MNEEAENERPGTKGSAQRRQVVEEEGKEEDTMEAEEVVIQSHDHYGK